MMNKKKTQYGLLLLTLAIWGAVLYRVYLAYGSEKPLTMVTTSYAALTEENDRADTFSIHHGYRDPFLDEAREENKIPVKQKQPENKVVKKEEPKEVPWPQVNYEGMIRNQESGKFLAMLRVNGKSSLLKPGELFEEVQLVKIFKDSVEVAFNRQNRYVRK